MDREKQAAKKAAKADMFISVNGIYTKEAIKARLGLGEAAIQSMHAGGLKRCFAGGRNFYLGEDVLRFFMSCGQGKVRKAKPKRPKLKKKDRGESECDRGRLMMYPVKEESSATSPRFRLITSMYKNVALSSKYCRNASPESSCLHQKAPRLMRGSGRWDDPRESFQSRANWAWKQFLLVTENCSVPSHRPQFAIVIVDLEKQSANEIQGFDRRFRDYMTRHGEVKLYLVKELDKSNRLHWHAVAITQLSRRELITVLSHGLSVASHGCVGIAYCEPIWGGYIHYMHKVKIVTPKKPVNSGWSEYRGYAKHLFRKNLGFQITTWTNNFFRDKKVDLLDRAFKKYSKQRMERMRKGGSDAK